ncbi:DnaJ sub C member 21 [Phytophthora boehmeriae]|uniref:DnaJ sub C member 21 n=1 Tax=Phytophthora boehmeriae TaxID=109152 RepID=A0A8T1VLI7_9STRA|nr:DnaJ sub C member 21 [Phytophthora boehmeriae]
MVKLVEYPDSSEDEHPDVDTRSDGSQWSSFGQIPSDASDSLSFRMRSPESDSDEDYAPSQASLSSLEGSHSPVSSVDTNDLEFPSDMEEDEPQEPHSQAAVDNSGEGQNQPQETKEDGHNLFYAWGDLKAAFEDNPFKRRSVQKEESEDAEETSTESPGEQETGNQEEEKTQWSLPVTGKSLGAQDTDRISQRKIFRPRRQTGAATLKPSGVTPTFSNFSTDNQAEDGGLQWENKTQREKVVSTPGDTTTSMFTASSSGTQDAFSFGSKQAKVESPAASTTDYTFGTPSWGLFSSGSDDAHMMSPPVSTATSAPPSGLDNKYQRPSYEQDG